METINALHNVNIFTSWLIVAGWTIEQKKQERFTQVDLFALGATSQSVELNPVKRQSSGTLR
jgi:hypothetical protein